MHADVLRRARVQCVHKHGKRVTGPKAWRNYAKRSRNQRDVKVFEEAKKNREYVRERV